MNTPRKRVDVRVPVRSGTPVLLVMLLAACGGGGSGGGGAGDNGGSSAGGSTAGQTTGPDLVSISASVAAPTVAGGGLTQINLVVANPGNAAAANVTANVDLGVGLASIVVSCSSQNGAVCPASPSSLATPSLPAGGSLRFAVVVSVAPGMRGSITSTVSVRADGDMVTANNRADVIISAYSADLRVRSTTSGGAFFSGAIATYKMTVSNAGPDAARDITIQAVPGPGQTLSSIACVASAASCPASVGAVLTVPELPNGESLEFTVNASIDPTTFGAISGTLHVNALGDPNPSDNVATSSATARFPVSPQSPSFVALRSDRGDFIGLGRSYYYDGAVAQIDVTASGNSLTVRVQGDATWTGEFVLPQSHATLVPGTYSNLSRYLFHDTAVGGLSWTGGPDGRGCNVLSGSLTVDAVTFVAGALETIDLYFVQHCESGVPSLRGQIHWNAGDVTHPPGPVNPPPMGLWTPPMGATPATGSYVYLQSDLDDWVGLGGLYRYTQADALLTLTPAANQLSVGILGNERWTGNFKAMSVLSTLEPGFYGDLHRFPFHNPARGGLTWSGEGRSCNRLNGWFAVDSIAYSAGSLTSIELRFEQRCDDVPGANGALRGKIYWDSTDPVQPAGPQNPPPTGLWSPPAGSTPMTGNYVFLQSDAGDFIGRGQTHVYTQADSSLRLSTIGARLELFIDGDEFWMGNFRAMSTLAQLEPGYYENFGQSSSHNPAFGGLSWQGEGRGCSRPSGWFVVDSISFSGGALAAIDLRFEQHCEHASPALRGEIHWALGDSTQPPGPQDPPPANLWSPPPGATPANGNYVYLSSSPGDYLGDGNTYTYTGADAILDVNADMWPSGPRLAVSVRGDHSWNGDFVGMSMLQRLEPGYYGNLERFPYHNPVRGGLNWLGQGRFCNDLTGWYVIDDVVYSGSDVESLDLRFEQSCDGLPPLHGAVHWTASDSTRPSGPELPPPANLWRPAPGETPASGNYVYLVSEPGDSVGAEQTYTITDASHTVTLEHDGGLFSIDISGGSSWWGGLFKAMDSISELEPGYYGGLQQYPVHNPARGGLRWYGQGRSCNLANGWFVVDSITYSAGSLASIDLRFEQRCVTLATPNGALRGEIHWIR